VNFDVIVDGKPWKVAVEPNESKRYEITVKGRRRILDVVWIDPDTISIVDSETHQAHRIEVGRAPRGSREVRVDGARFTAVVEAKRGRASDPVSGDGRIVAPMPGRVVRVMVAAGDRVTARQPVVVVEAMKMENELRAPHDGVVRTVSVSAGTAIEAGAELLVIG
jgi:biotin carboxyl carrier protein